MLNGQLGDILQTTPILSALKRKWPEAKIDYCLHSKCKEALDKNPFVDEIIYSDKFGRWSFTPPWSLLRLAITLRKKRYDIAICLGADTSYRFVAYMSGIKCIASLIDKDYKKAWADVIVVAPYDQQKPRVLNYYELGLKLGLEFNRGLLPVIRWSKEDETYIDNLIKNNYNNIAIFAGTGKNANRPWAQRGWLVDKWVDLINIILSNSKKTNIFLIGKDNDKNINKKIVNNISEKRIIDLTDKTTIQQLAYLFTKCKLLISTDSSPVFVGAATGCPLVVLYGPEWPERSQPVGSTNWNPVYVDLDCRDYCCSFPAKPPVCKNECMANISVDMVYEKAKGYL